MRATQDEKFTVPMFFLFFLIFNYGSEEQTEGTVRPTAHVVHHHCVQPFSQRDDSVMVCINCIKQYLNGINRIRT